MRLILLTVAAVSGAMCQTLSEVGAAATGSVAGGAAGKKVSDGITSVLDKVDQHTTAAAATAPKPAPTKPVAPLLQVSPGVVGTGLPVTGAAPVSPAPRASAKVPVGRAVVTDSVPPPPPLASEAVKRVEAPKPPSPVVVVEVAPPPPPPPVTPEDLLALTVGQAREEVLKLGQPASRITMFEDGHLLEIYRYMSGDITFGVVRLENGAVSQVDVR